MEFDYYFKRGIKPDLDAAPPAGYVLVNVPFCGFYESYLNAMLDSCIECEIDYLGNEEALDERYKEAYVNMDDVGKQWLDTIATTFELDSPIYVGISCPKEYNFSTNKLWAYVKHEDMKKCVSNCDESQLVAEIRYATTPSSGYMPFFHYEDATFDEDMPSPLWVLVFEALMKTKGIEMFNLFEDTFEFCPFNELVEWVEKPTSSAA